MLAWKRTSSDHNLYRFEAARGLWDFESEIEEPENQESEFFSCCCFDSQSERLSEEAATCQRIDSKRSQEDRMRSLENQITVLTDKLENPPEEQRPAQ